ncbi:hypothetical protein E2320_009070 [Naja naja]|nr:hypothetical protein E2320_009070 [Naja naja]
MRLFGIKPKQKKKQRRQSKSRAAASADAGLSIDNLGAPRLGTWMDERCDGLFLIFVKTSLLKWVAIHQTLKKRLKAEEKRNIVEGHLQAVPPIVEVIAIKNQEENQDHGLEMSSFVHIRMKKGEGIDQAAVLRMGPKENGVIADQEHKENHIGLRDQDQRADQEG